MIDEPRPVDDNSSALEPGQEWVKLARDAFHDSTTYLQTNCYQRWKKSLAHFQNQHAPDSKYRTNAYKGRARTFRPKTRSGALAQEAALAVAGFSTSDLAVVQPSDPVNPENIAAAEVGQYLLQYYLDRRLPWFLTTIGAFQDTFNYGLAISHVYWDYEEEVVLNEQGMAEAPRIAADQLRIDNVAPENFRFAPGADWRDPVGTSPYLIEMIPMFVGDIQQRMQSDGHNQPWFKYTRSEILSYGNKHGDDHTVRNSREGNNRTDPLDTHSDGSFATAWVHRNIVKDQGTDWIYYTLGTERLLTIPTPLAEVCPLGRDYVVGHSMIESHKAYPAGGNELTSNMQQEMNDIANQRMDNVRLALNARYFFRRRKGIDLQALSRSKPGSAVAMDDPANDVVVHRPPEVTSSSYQEQNMLGLEIDEILGAFSQSTVQNNRQLNETVGGMQMMNTGAGQIREYFIRIFTETWMEPVLRMAMKHIQLYETDQTLIALAEQEAQTWQKIRGDNPDLDWLLTRDLLVTVNVGIGNTDPQQRVQRIIMGVSNVATLPGMGERLAGDEVAKEVFGALGFKSAERFFPQPDPNAQPQPSPEQAATQMQMQLEQMKLEAQQQIEQMKAQTEMQIEQMKLELSSQRMQMDGQIQSARVAQERELKLADLAAREQLKVSELAARVGIAEKQDKTKRDIEALRGTLHNNELSYKIRTGNPGI